MTGIEGLRRSKRLARVPGLQSEVTSNIPNLSGAGTPYLPLEVKILVGKFLEKSDLKSLRCVSQEWHAMATPLLFDKVYVSPRHQDLQIYSHITKHTLLSTSVKKLVCDVSHIPALSHGTYFDRLCEQLRAMTPALSMQSPFTSPHAWLNEFLTAFQRAGRSRRTILSQYANEEYIKDGFLLWQELAKADRQFLHGGAHSKYYSDLCSGLHQLSNLQSVSMKNDIWCKVGKDTSDIFQPKYSKHTPSAILAGSPLARSWVPWHLRPEGSKDGGLAHFYLMMQALSTTRRSVKHFDCHDGIRKGLSPLDFAVFDMTERLPCYMATALKNLQTLKLQITPCSCVFINHENAGALGFLPHLIERLTNLKRLDLILVTNDRLVKRFRGLVTPLDDTCYHSSQVFARSGKWKHLEHLYISGLAIDGLDMIFLFFYQMPKLTRLWLNRIDLLGARWDSAVEALRFRGAIIPWETLSLEGSFRHGGTQWWPCDPDTHEENLALMNYARYAQDGGHHPSLPATIEDRLAENYFDEIFTVAGLERVQDLRRRIQQIEDRPTWHNHHLQVPET